jgi:hypothetical protein
MHMSAAQLARRRERRAPSPRRPWKGRAETTRARSSNPRVSRVRREVRHALTCPKVQGRMTRRRAMSEASSSDGWDGEAAG